ncbi:MAG: glycosyltransferase [Mastigocoleus sp.]
MKIAYLVNQYPKVSHSFIRREIWALEKSGLYVERFSLRSCASELVDPKDKLELNKTKVLLDIGLWGLLFNLMLVAMQKPISLIKAFWLAVTVGIRSSKGIAYHLIYLAEACALYRHLFKLHINHVHSHFGTNSTAVAMLCSALGGITYSFTVHGPEEFDKAENLSLTQKINRAAFVVAISSFGRSQLYRWCNREQWQKIHVVRCGVDESFLNREQHKISSQTNLTCIGRLCEQKGQLLLLQSLKMLSLEGLEFNLTLVGDGEMRPEIELLIQEYGLQQQVKITGWASSEQVRRYIQNSRALVLPSFAEGLPVVLMEALALGRPVISTYVAGIPELVKPGMNGWLVPAGSVEDLTAAIRTVLELPSEELELMGETGVQSVFQQHDITQEAKKLVELFNNILDESSYSQSGDKLRVSLMN